MSNKPKKSDKVSVIIPTVNAHEELGLAIESIKKNSDHPIDLVIVVDPDMNTGKHNEEILKVCKKHDIKPLKNKKNLGPYGNWNKGAKNAKTNWLIFATDDQYFAPHWDSNLLKYWKPRRLISGRLIEPGIIPVWQTNIKKNFGVLPQEFKEEEFINWCKSRDDEGFEEGGFFVPMLQHRDDYKKLGGYPTKGKFGTSKAVSNDVVYVQEAQKKGYEFGTASDSYSYHFQASSWKKKTLNPKIAAIVLTNNSQETLPQTLKTLKWTQSIIIVDSGSTDKTLDIAKKHKCNIYKKDFEDFASQRNFALEKASEYDWVLMIDDDEELEKGLAGELQSFAKDIYLDGVEIPRKNYIFDRWIKHTDWYPDYRLVFFRPKIVQYKSKVHERAHFIKGNKETAEAKNHIIHRNYTTVGEFLQKNLVDYPQHYAEELNRKGKKAKPINFLEKPLSEFMRRFFLKEGYKDGMYGLVLSTLMAAQEAASYAYLWEIQGKEQDLTQEETQEIFAKLKDQGKEISYWLITLSVKGSKGLQKLAHRARRKLHKTVNNL